MINVVKRIEIEPIVPEKREVFAKRVQFVKIYAKHENTVNKTMLLRAGAMMHHSALINPGSQLHGGLPIRVVHRSMAEVRASSWKPYLK